MTTVMETEFAAGARGTKEMNAVAFDQTIAAGYWRRAFRM